MQDIQTFSIVIATIGLLVGITYYIIILRNSKHTRQAQLYMQFLTMSMNKEWIQDAIEVYQWVWKDVTEYNLRYSSLEAAAKIASVAQYFIGMGTMVKENLIKPQMVPALLAVIIRGFWKKYQPILAHLTDDVHAFDMIEYLYHRIQIPKPEHPPQ